MKLEHVSYSVLNSSVSAVNDVALNCNVAGDTISQDDVTVSQCSQLESFSSIHPGAVQISDCNSSSHPLLGNPLQEEGEQLNQ